jgi:hypothetical protein
VVKEQKKLKKAKNIAKIKGMKEGALSAQITFFEKDWRSSSGTFIPKNQKNKISEIFQKPSVIRETRHQTLNTLQTQLYSVDSDIRNQFAQSLSPKNINMFDNS